MSEWINMVRTLVMTKRSVQKMGDKYVIQLSREYDELWEYLRRSNAKVDVVIIIRKDNARG
ncbi:MAG: hypothetical protein RQ842_11430 [Vulcanisaeta sp.]|jgi:hypothetical protein|nr:hypothetical protein [Vulcanisaeta sp.]